MAGAGDSDKVLGQKGLIHRLEFVRIIIQALFSLGYGRAAAVLEEESGIPLHSLGAAKGLRDSILSGDWDGAISFLSSLCGSLLPKGGKEREALLKLGSFLLLQRKFAESVEEGDLTSALKTLRTRISPLGVDSKRVHSLALHLVFPSSLCPRPPSTRNGRNNEGKLGESAIYNINNNSNNNNNNNNSGDYNSARLEILEEVRRLLPAPALVRERRLEELVEKALSAQRERCIYHNLMDSSLSLYEDHSHCDDQLPRRTRQVLNGHKDEVWFLQFSNNGKYLASASKDNTAIIWEFLEMNDQYQHDDTNCNLSNLASHDELSVYEVINGNYVEFKHMLKGHEKPVSLVAWSPDDTMLLTCGNEDVIKLWDTKTGQYKRTFEVLHTLNACAWFPCSKRFATGGGDRCIRIWDTEKTRNRGRPISTRGCKVSELAVIWRGRCVLIVHDREIWIHDVEEGGEGTERVLIKEEKLITSLSTTRDEGFLLTSLVNEIHLWNIQRDIAELMCIYKGHAQIRYVIRSCFGGWDQAFIASGSEDSQVYIWHRKNGKPLNVLEGHSGTVNCVTWSPTNPQMLASASDDHTIRIWGITKSVHLNLGNDVNTN